MPHLRKRNILGQIQKSIKFWPVTSILGPRQCGKSTLLGELFSEKTHSEFVSLDRKADRKMAEENPELFLNRFSIRPLIIDEAHKSPELFDEIKAEVDSSRRPGLFLLSGSIYFSKKIGIQESLTGRSSVIRMDALTLPETTEKKTVTLKEVLQYLKQGGMPGVCFIRNQEHVRSYWEQWIETTCYRDLKIFSKGRLSGDLAEEILESCSQLELPNLSLIAKKLGVDARRVNSHIEALEDLFVLRKVGPSSAGIGKDIYLPFDCGLAQHFGANDRRLWQVGFLSHQLNLARFDGLKVKAAHYYLTSRHSFIDFVLNDTFHLFCDKPNPSRSELMTIQAARKAHPKLNCVVHCATEAFKTVKQKDFTLMGWGEGFGRSLK